jgi:hypothetical protein
MVSPLCCSEKIGDEWPVHLEQLAQLKQWADDPAFQRSAIYPNQTLLNFKGFVSLLKGVR